MGDIIQVDSAQGCADLRRRQDRDRGRVVGEDTSLRRDDRRNLTVDERRAQDGRVLEGLRDGQVASCDDITDANL